MSSTIADELISSVDAAAERLRLLSDVEASSRPAPGKWSPKELVGHLIDSAANNHQRFVRAQHRKPLVLPNYAQDDWVRFQRYDDGTWTELVELWRLYNRHLAHVIRHLPDEILGVRCQIGSDAPVTLSVVVEDYLAHLKHHLRQLP